MRNVGIFNFTTALCGLGASGAVASGVIGWHHLNTQRYMGYRFAPRNPFSNSTARALNDTRDLNEFAFSSGDCFNSFFPGAQFPFIDDTTTIPEDFTFSPTDTGSDLMGCKIMNVSRTDDKKVLYYKGETTVKNDRFGISISSSATVLKSHPDNNGSVVFKKTGLRFGFVVLFLEKQDSGWVTQGGYSWELHPPQPSASTKDKLIIKPPIKGRRLFDQEMKHLFPEKSDSPTTFEPKGQKWKNSTFSGIWHSPASSSSEKDAVEILEADAVEKKWGLDPYYHEDQTDNKNKVKPSVLFNGRKGTWSTTEYYCADLRDKKWYPANMSEQDLNLCYTKDS